MHLEVMREPAAREHVGQTGRQIARCRRLRVVLIGLRLEQRLGADEGGAVGVLAMDQRDQARLRQFGLAAVADRDFGRAFQVDAAVVRRERVRRQILHLAAGLHAADARAPAVFLESAVDVGRHRRRPRSSRRISRPCGRRYPPRRRIPRPARSLRRRAAGPARAACTARHSGRHRNRAAISRRHIPACRTAC